jgi:hypothetical protein
LLPADRPSRPKSRRENFNRFQWDHGNESTAESGSGDAYVAIFMAVSTCRQGSVIFAGRPSGTIVRPGAEGIGEMRHLRSLLRAAPSRIGRRLALIVAIAAASLPDAGA